MNKIQGFLTAACLLILSSVPNAFGRTIDELVQEIVTLSQQFNANSGPASIRLIFPAPRIVYQQDNQKNGRILVEGTSGGNPTHAFVRLQSRSSPNGAAQATWTEIPINSQTGKFQSSIAATAGWYDLKIMTFRGSALQGVATVQRVGVGEVFLIAGQSNAYGSYSEKHVAQDDRVSVLNVNAGGVIDPANLPLSFAQAGPGTVTGPKGNLFYWAEMADLLVKRFNTPVLLFNVSHPGTSVQDWVRTKNGEENVVPYAAHPNAPYYHMRIVLQNYIRRLGIRSVLWHQGEFDGGVYTTNNTGNPEDRVDPGTPLPGQPQNLYKLVQPTTPAEYASRLTEIVQESRKDSGHSNLAWVVARASYMPYLPPNFYGNGYAPMVIQGQNKIIEDKNVGNIFAGPNTDTAVSPQPAERPDGCHFGESVFSKVAKLWSDSLTNTFFTSSAPLVPIAYSNPKPELLVGVDATQSAWATTGDPEASQKLESFSTVIQAFIPSDIITGTESEYPLTPGFTVSIGPSPVVGDQATLRVSDLPTSGYTPAFVYRIFDSRGREVLQGNEPLQGSLTEIRLNLGNLPVGVYIIQVELDWGRQVYRERKKFAIAN